ncbi:MAG: radical SAM protein [Magnetococcales bacterium]|nr:radical SAM protein [Magnetococcales bacterium]NGZ26632.1 radical SAM protein [Magnetococcales bacterium]
MEPITPLWRPPSEGDNLILQVTLGCSHNQCTFCGMYRHRSFVSKPLAVIQQEVAHAAMDWPDARRIFLADGDALALDYDQLLAILQLLQACFPQLNRVSCYASPGNLGKKSLPQLQTLRENKLTLLYYGMESGHAPLLRMTRKGATPAFMAEGLHKAAEAGMKISATVILGLGGRHLWREHVEDTALLLQQVPLNFLSTLQLYLEPEMAAAFAAPFTPPFVPQDDQGMLQEQYLLLERLTHTPRPVIFRSNHASNALALAGTLPKDRPRLLAQLTAALQGHLSLRPAWLRGL